MWHLETGFSGGLSGIRLMVALGDLERFFPTSAILGLCETVVFEYWHLLVSVQNQN